MLLTNLRDFPLAPRSILMPSIPSVISLPLTFAILLFCLFACPFVCSFSFVCSFHHLSQFLFICSAVCYFFLFLRSLLCLPKHVSTRVPCQRTLHPHRTKHRNKHRRRRGQDSHGQRGLDPLLDGIHWATKPPGLLGT